MEALKLITVNLLCAQFLQTYRLLYVVQTRFQPHLLIQHYVGMLLGTRKIGTYHL